MTVAPTRSSSSVQHGRLRIFTAVEAKSEDEANAAPSLELEASPDGSLCSASSPRRWPSVSTYVGKRPNARAASAFVKRARRTDEKRIIILNNISVKVFRHLLIITQVTL